MKSRLISVCPRAVRSRFDRTCTPYVYRSVNTAVWNFYASDPNNMRWRALCQYLSSVTAALCDVSVLSGWVSMKLATNICHVGAEHCWKGFQRRRSMNSSVASYEAVGHTRAPRLPTFSFLAYFGVNMTTNYPNIALSARSSGAECQQLAALLISTTLSINQSINLFVQM